MRKSRVHPLAIVALLLWPVAAAVAQEVQADPLARATLPLTRLIPPLPSPSFIADVPQVLTAQEHARLDQRIRAHQDAGLGDIAVAVLPSIGDFAPVDVALATYRTWRVGTVAEVGSARRNLGVLLLIVPKETAPDHKGQCFISTGPGVQGVITDATAAKICREAIIPALRTRAYAAAISAGIEQISARLARDEGIAQAAAERTASPESAAPVQPAGTWAPALLLGLALLGVLGASIAFLRWRRRYSPRTCVRCGQLMQRLSTQDEGAYLSAAQRKEQGLASVDYDVWHCRCGEQLLLPYVKWGSRYSLCGQCGARTVTTSRRILLPPTTVSPGLANTTTRCKNCQNTTTRKDVLPQLPTTSSGSERSSGASSSDGGSSDSGGGSSDSGGGSSNSGGGSFGGSGSNDGGGGGSSY